MFLYDAAPGGVGLTEKLYDLRAVLPRVARDHAGRCPCEAGCPSCVGPSNEVTGNPKQAALLILERLTAHPASPAVVPAPDLIPHRERLNAPILD